MHTYIHFPARKSRHDGSSGICIHKFAWEVLHNFTGSQKQVTEIWGRNSLVNITAMIISQCMVGIESYHTPRNVGTIGINKADSLGQGCGKRARGTVCTGTNKGPHMIALQVVDQRIWSTTSINARKTSATRGFMQGPVSSEPPIRPSPQHYHRHPIWELAIHRL